MLVLETCGSVIPAMLHHRFHYFYTKSENIVKLCNIQPKMENSAKIY